MTEDQWQALAPFAEADAKAREAFSASQAMNVPTGTRERLEADLYFMRCKVEMQQAHSAFDDARKRILGE
jgi:hypothetical protein